MTLGSLAFGALGAGLVVTALLVVLARDVIHGVLAMIAHFLLTAVLYVALHAPFIAMVQVAVYAGAIMVLFLFVVMLMGGGRATTVEPRSTQRWLGIPLAAVLAAAMIAAIAHDRMGRAGAVAPAALPDDFGSPAAIGELLYGGQLLAFEMVGVLLLVAVIGAVVIAMERRDEQPRDPRGNGGPWPPPTDDVRDATGAAGSVEEARP